MKRFDPIDIFFIGMIIAYFLTLFLILLTYFITKIYKVPPKNKSHRKKSKKRKKYNIIIRTLFMKEVKAKPKKSKSKKVVKKKPSKSKSNLKKA